MDWRDEELKAQLTEELDQETQFTLGESIDDPLPKVSGDLQDLEAPEEPKIGDWRQEIEAEDEPVLTGPSKERRLLLSALAISLFVHAALASIVLNSRLSFQQDSTPDFVEIQLIPSNPLLPEEELEPAEIAESEPPVVEELAAESEEEIIEESLEQVVEETVEELVEETIPEEIVEEAPTEIVEVIEADQSVIEELEPVDNAPEVFVPSLVSVQQSLDAIEEENATRLWAYDCDALEEESELRTCNPTDRRNYDVVERNTIYEALNPVRELSRGVRTLPTVASDAPELAARLRASDLPSSLSDYVMEQVEAGITHNTNPGNIVIEHMNMMTENEAAAQAREVMNNPWAQLRAKERQQRNVHAQ